MSELGEALAQQEARAAALEEWAPVVKAVLPWCHSCAGRGRYTEAIDNGYDSGGGAWAQRRIEYKEHNPCEECAPLRALLEGK